MGERGLELVHPGDYSDYSASLNQAEADALCEISFDDDAFSAPVADCVLGVCTCSETWNPLAATEFQIVLQSPQRDKGVVLMAVWHSEDAEDAVRNIWEKLEVSEQLAVKGSDAYRSVRARVRALAEVEKSHYHVLAFLKLLVSNDYIRRAPADEALVQEIGKLALDLRVKECDSCPICLEAIAAEDAVMRCSGAGGGLHQLHHYFHAECLREWILGRSGHEQKLGTITAPYPSDPSCPFVSCEDPDGLQPEVPHVSEQSAVERCPLGVLPRRLSMRPSRAYPDETKFVGLVPVQIERECKSCSCCIPARFLCVIGL